MDEVSNKRIPKQRTITYEDCMRIFLVYFSPQPHSEGSKTHKTRLKILFSVIKAANCNRCWRAGAHLNPLRSVFEIPAPRRAGRLDD